MALSLGDKINTSQKSRSKKISAQPVNADDAAAAADN